MYSIHILQMRKMKSRGECQSHPTGEQSALDYNHRASLGQDQKHRNGVKTQTAEFHPPSFQLSKSGVGSMNVNLSELRFAAAAASGGLKTHFANH